MSATSPLNWPLTPEPVECVCIPVELRFDRYNDNEGKKGYKVRCKKDLQDINPFVTIQINSTEILFRDHEEDNFAKVDYSDPQKTTVQFLNLKGREQETIPITNCFERLNGANVLR